MIGNPGYWFSGCCVSLFAIALDDLHDFNAVIYSHCCLYRKLLILAVIS